MNYKYIYILFVVLMACDKKAKIPAYISVSDIKFDNKSPSINGFAGSKITDAWVYANEKFIGVFELPCEVPIISEGNTEIRIEPGIKVNGISATRSSYIFYSSWKTTLNLQPNRTYSLEPIVDYKNVDIVWLENFEDSSFDFDTLNLGGNTSIERVITDVSEKEIYQNYVGSIILDETHNILNATSSNSYSLPFNALAHYIEFDYSCNQIFIINMIQIPNLGIETHNTLIFLNPTTNSITEKNWNHIYVDITDYIRAGKNTDKFKFGIYAKYNDINTKGIIYIDNFKIIN